MRSKGSSKLLAALLGMNLSHSLYDSLLLLKDFEDDGGVNAAEPDNLRASLAGDGRGD